MTKYKNFDSNMLSNEKIVKMEYKKFIESYLPIINDSNLVNYLWRLKKYGKNAKYSEKNLIETYKFIIYKFIAKGLSREDANEYMLNNKKLFDISKKDLVCSLSYLDMINLGDKAFFENPEFLVKYNNPTKIYGIVRCLAKRFNKSSINLSDVDLYLILSSSQVPPVKEEESLTDYKANCYYQAYICKLQNQLSSIKNDTKKLTKTN